MQSSANSTSSAAMVTRLNKRVRGLRLRMAGHSEAGHVRTMNQDSYILEYLNDHVLLAAVADGMGGHKHGEYASQRATEVLHDELLLSPTISPNQLAQAIYQANLDIFQTAEHNPDSRGMGTTLTTMLLEGNDCLIGHVGDSRAYLIRDNTLKQLTQDHSWVADRVRQGVLTEDEARHHRWRNVITNVVGATAEVNLDLHHLELQAGDHLFICSDGISSLITEEGIVDIISNNLPHEAVSQLMETANEAGSPDNITAIVISIDHANPRRKNYIPPNDSSPQQIALVNPDTIHEEVNKLYPSNIPAWQRRLHSQVWYPYRFWGLGIFLALLLYIIGTR